MLANTKRAMAITARLNHLSFNEADEVRALFSELIGQKLDDSVLLIPPFYTAGGTEIKIGRNVFINQNCTFYDLGGLHIHDDVMIGPNVNLITTSHDLAPAKRHTHTIGKPIVIERNAFIATGATIIGGVTIGENSVVVYPSRGLEIAIPPSQKVDAIILPAFYGYPGLLKHHFSTRSD